MECLSPIVISNHTKFLSLAHADRLKYEVRCGKCANCQQTFQSEWYFRAFHEFQSTVKRGGYMLMDCLTYSPKYVPRVSRFIPRLPRQLNFMCFDYTDLRYFMVRLRTYLKKRGFNVDKTLRYFAAAEYGTAKDCTHRPHYHVLFYVTTPGLDNYTLSKAISSCWKYGRTDGLPYKSKAYIDNYTISDGLVSSQRVCKYVSKYVMKSSEFQKVVDKRLAAIMHYIYADKFTTFKHGDYHFEVDYYYRMPKEVFDWSGYEAWLKSQTARLQMRNLKSHLNQFHRQSLGFGLSAIDGVDIQKVIDTNLLSILDGKRFVMRIALPTYYKRKLFYQLVDYDGVKTWQLSDLGRIYKKKRDEDLASRLSDSFILAKRNYDISLDSEKLVDYVMNKRFRLKGAPFSESTFDERLDSLFPIYNYSSSSDKKYFHQSFVTNTYLGNKNNEYQYLQMFEMIDYNVWLKDNSFEDAYLESQLFMLKEKKLIHSQKIQSNFDNKQRLNQVYKNIIACA